MSDGKRAGGFRTGVLRAAFAAAVLLTAALGVVLTVLTLRLVQEKRFSHQVSLGEKYLEEMKYEEAVIAFKTALRIEPRQLQAYLGLADAYAGSGEEDRAVKSLELAAAVIREEYENNGPAPEQSGMVLDRLLSSYEEREDEEAADEVRQLYHKVDRDWEEETENQKPEADGETEKDAEKDTAKEPENGAEASVNESEGLTQETVKDIGEDELRRMLESAASNEILTFIYCDLNRDGIHEAVALTGVSDHDLGFVEQADVWLVEESGARIIMNDVTGGSDSFDFCTLEVVDAGREQHVVVNENMIMGSRKNCTSSRLENGELEEVYQGYGEVFMSDGRLWFGIEDYDGMESDLGMLGHTWKNYPIFYENGSYKEYGGTEISMEKFMSYGQAPEAWDKMVKEVLGNNPQARYEYQIWDRGNGLLSVDFGVYGQEGYRTFSHAYLMVEGGRVVLKEDVYYDDKGRIESSYCTREGTLGSSGTGLEAVYR